MSDENIQYKAPHYQSGQQIEVTTQNETESSLALLRALETAGASFKDRQCAIQIIEQFHDEHGDARAAMALRQIVERIGGGKKAEELRLALMQAFDGSRLTADASAWGVKRPTLWLNIQRLRERIFGPVVTKRLKRAKGRETCVSRKTE